MKLNPDSYVPSLRWRMGEYQALFRLAKEAKDRVVPLVLVPEIEFDFEEWRAKKTVQEHVKPFAKRFKDKWSKRPAWVDVHPSIETSLLDDGKLVVAHVFDEMRKLGCMAVPVTSLDAPPEINAAVAAIVKADQRGVGIRARLEHIMKPSYSASLATLIGTIGALPADTDLIIDLGAPNYEPYDDFADGLVAAIDMLGDLSGYRSLIVMGSAYPESVSLDKPGGELPRHDWAFFQVLIKKLGDARRRPTYSDYTIVNPRFTPRDMRKIKSGGRVVYTSGNNWVVRKGGAFRDNPEQMHDHCAFIVSSRMFKGAAFSEGDDYIAKCATRAVGPSNQPRWKQIAISHHIMQVLEDLATPGAPA